MQPCTTEMQVTINSLQQISPPTHLDPNSHDNFLNQMFSTPPTSSWQSPWDLVDNMTPSNGVYHLDDSAILRSELRQHQISGNSLLTADVVNNQGGEANSVQPLFNQPPHFYHPQAQIYGGTGTVRNQAPEASGSSGGSPAQPRQKIRARRGQATDPHSIAERLRRERIAERMKALQELVPNANKTDKATMLDEITDYVKFLQLQVKVMSMSRLGGGGNVAPLLVDLVDLSEGGGGDCIQSNGNQTPSSNDTLTVTEQQVAKLMEKDMGTAMQFLQGKGLCLMPISLATTISAGACQSRNSMMPHGYNGSPSMSVLTVQSNANNDVD